jgi:hypothetical protein
MLFMELQLVQPGSPANRNTNVLVWAPLRDSVQ